jgi:VanZ family protein
MNSTFSTWPWRRLVTILVVAVLVVYWGAIFAATHMPPVHLPTRVPYNDKLAHFTAYAGLAFWLTLALYLLRPFRWRWPLVAVVIAAVYGMLDEFTQSFVGRDMDVKDWVADVLGALVGAVAGLIGFLLLRSIRRWLLPLPSDALGPAKESLHG